MSRVMVGTLAIVMLFAFSCGTTNSSVKNDFPEAHRHLSEMVDYSREPQLFSRLETALENFNTISKERVELLFSLGKAKLDFKDYAASFSAYSEANRITKELTKYSFESDRILFNSLKCVAPHLSKIKVTMDKDERLPVPIFILGMPRSGTTLVEQILSSHSYVEGGGEIPFLRDLGGGMAVGKTLLSLGRLKRLNNEYLLKMNNISNGKPYITDKLPHNFLLIPLIMSALPRAKVIHVKRDPIATCWSNFTQHFTATGLAYSNDLKDLENYYLLYNDLLHEWDNLYSGKIYHCTYDRLVQNPKKETRNLLSFINLSWEERCLFPNENKRQVNTASHNQVRKKIYQGSSENWKKYEDYLKNDFKKLRKLRI